MIRVLESAEPPNDRTNPYLIQLVDSFPPTVRPDYFSWRLGLTGDFDVFHLHWPEVRLRGRTATRSVARWVLFLLMLLRIKVTGRAIVRTLHNATPHDSLPALSRALVRLCDRWTVLWILLTDVTPSPADSTVVIPHGHYRDWFASYERSEPVTGRILHVGLIRRYKGIPALLRAFSALANPDLTLRVVGLTIDEEVASTVREAEASDPRIVFLEEFVPEAALVREITASELVVLPFSSVTNSGSLLLALSLDRPVLVPRIPLTERLAAEVGPEWVLTYEEPLDPHAIESALRAVRGRDEGSSPDLSARGWEAIGTLHASAFERAIHRTRDRRRR